MTFHRVRSFGFTRRIQAVAYRKEAPMSHTMNAYADTMNGSVERAAATRHTQSLVRRAGLTLAMAAVWGFAAGSAKPMLALLDVYKVPMVLSLSVVVALPAVLVTRRLL